MGYGELTPPNILRFECGVALKINNWSEWILWEEMKIFRFCLFMLLFIILVFLFRVVWEGGEVEEKSARVSCSARERWRLSRRDCFYLMGERVVIWTKRRTRNWHIYPRGIIWEITNKQLLWEDKADALRVNVTVIKIHFHT